MTNGQIVQYNSVLDMLQVSFSQTQNDLLLGGHLGNRWIS